MIFLLDVCLSTSFIRGPTAMVHTNSSFSYFFFLFYFYQKSFSKQFYVFVWCQNVSQQESLWYNQHFLIPVYDNSYMHVYISLGKFTRSYSIFYLLKYVMISNKYSKTNWKLGFFSVTEYSEMSRLENECEHNNKSYEKRREMQSTRKKRRRWQP
jgi:hypothetical protein